MKMNFIFFIFAYAPILAHFPAPAAGMERVERRIWSMGTELSISVEADSLDAARASSERALRSVEAVEARLSTWRPDSELSRLNRAPAGRRIPVSRDLLRDLAAAYRCWRDTRGAFSPGLGALVETWGLRKDGRRPGPIEQAAALADVDMGALEIGDGWVIRRSPGFAVEEGGFGKGAALDRAGDLLRGAGVFRAVLDFGGQALVYGGGADFAIADPRDRRRPVLRVNLPSGSMATSGNSERGRTNGGERIGHILDPRTGAPATDFGSLTVWAEGALSADCLSTGLYVMGPEPALAWAAAAGVEIVVLTNPGNGPPIRAVSTPGFRVRLSPLVPDIEIITWPVSAGWPRSKETLWRN